MTKVRLMNSDAHPRLDDVSVHVLAALAAAQFRDERISLVDLCTTLSVRRADVRRAISGLHEAGLVDALRMRLTLQGFAAGHALGAATLRPLRSSVSEAAPTFVAA